MDTITLTKPAKTRPTECHKCGGAGGFMHWPGFTCFRCAGSGVDPKFKTWNFPFGWTAEERQEFLDKKTAQNERARTRRWEKKQAEKKAKMDAFYTTLDDDVATSLREIDALDFELKHGITVDILDKLHQWGSISQPQIDLIFKVQTEREEDAATYAAIPDLEEGKYTIEGVILSIKWKESQWGGQLKMTVELDNGTKVWGTMPTSLDESEKGDRIRFIAQVTPSEDDRTFGFFKRPTKGEVIT